MIYADRGMDSVAFHTTPMRVISPFENEKNKICPELFTYILSNKGLMGHMKNTGRLIEPHKT